MSGRSTVHTVTTGRLLAMVCLMLIAGAGIGWVVHKQLHLLQQLQCPPAAPATFKTDEIPSLREIAPKWHKA